MQKNILINNFYEVDYSDIVFPIITVYKKPLDFPDKYVARLFDMNKPTNCIMIADTIGEIRFGIPASFSLIMPTPEDDKNIVEIYL